MTDMNDIRFVDDQERELFARAQLGEQVRSFLTSSVGRYLHGRARNELEQCQVDALNANPTGFWGRRKWRKIQERAAISRQFMSWLADAIVDGENAYKELEDYRKEP